LRVPSEALVVVADGRRMLLLRNKGDEEYPDLKVEQVEEHPNPATSEQGRDEPGRAFANAGAGPRTSGHQGATPPGASMHSAAYSETDWHQLEEDRFAGEVAEILKKRALAHDFRDLIVVAPPRALSELRKNYHKEVEKTLLGELPKDLTGHTVPDIEKHLKAA